MTNQTLYSQLRKRIGELVPDVNLKGRRGYVKGSSCPDCGEELGLGSDGETIFCPRCPFLESDKSSLGRDPSLADVLMAMMKKEGENREISNYCHGTTDITMTLDIWYLPLPLSGQSEEVLKFLNEVLG